MSEQIYITAQKKQELESEMVHLKTVVRPAISERLQAARALGDLSENAEYQSSRDEQGKNEGRIQEIEYILKYAKLVERSGSSKVELGATVVVEKQGLEMRQTYLIVSETEADLAANKVSTTSPLGAAMIGKNAGDSFTMITPRGEVDYKIISVE